MDERTRTPITEEREMRSLKREEVQVLVGVGGIMLVAIGVGFSFGWPGGVIAIGLLMFIGAFID